MTREFFFSLRKKKLGMGHKNDPPTYIYIFLAHGASLSRGFKEPIKIL